MKNYKNRRKIGFHTSIGDQEDDCDQKSRSCERGSDPRVKALICSFAYTENITEADEFLLISQIRSMCNVYPIKDKDPIAGLLNELEDHGFMLRVDEINRMGYPVKRITPFLKLTQSNTTDECD